MKEINSTSFPLLKTTNLLLRQLEPGDINEIFLLRSDRGVNEFLDRQKAESMDDAANFIQKIITATKNNESFYWAIVPQTRTKLAGTIGLWNISKEESKAEIGYELLPGFQGKGIMQESIAKVIEFVFSVLDLKTIEAWTHPGNLASLKLLQKNNFKRDMQAEDHIREKDKSMNMLIYTLTKL
jgi:[ribosomal protein S5]-alanine N-acetyltransferase